MITALIAWLWSLEPWDYRCASAPLGSTPRRGDCRMLISHSYSPHKFLRADPTCPRL
jgi:hypothetical protein